MKTQKATPPGFLPKTMKDASLTRKQSQDYQGGWRSESDMNMQQGGGAGDQRPPTFN